MLPQNISVMKRLSAFVLAALALSGAVLFSSSCKKDGPAPEDPDSFTVTNYVIIDGVTSPIMNVRLDKDDFEKDHWDISISTANTYEVYIELDKVYHNGKTLDLTKYEAEHEGWYWAVSAYTDKSLFNSFALEDDGDTLFETGTLRVKQLSDVYGSPVFNISLNGGKITDPKEGDGKEHTISIQFKGIVIID